MKEFILILLKYICATNKTIYRKNMNRKDHRFDKKNLLQTFHNQHNENRVSVKKNNVLDFPDLTNIKKEKDTAFSLFVSSTGNIIIEKYLDNHKIYSKNIVSLIKTSIRDRSKLSLFRNKMENIKDEKMKKNLRMETTLKRLTCNSNCRNCDCDKSYSKINLSNVLEIPIINNNSPVKDFKAEMNCFYIESNNNTRKIKPYNYLKTKNSKVFKMKAVLVHRKYDFLRKIIDEYFEKKKNGKDVQNSIYETNELPKDLFLKIHQKKKLVCVRNLKTLSYKGKILRLFCLNRSKFLKNEDKLYFNSNVLNNCIAREMHQVKIKEEIFFNIVINERLSIYLNDIKILALGEYEQNLEKILYEYLNIASLIFYCYFDYSDSYDNLSIVTSCFCFIKDFIILFLNQEAISEEEWQFSSNRTLRSRYSTKKEYSIGLINSIRICFLKIFQVMEYTEKEYKNKKIYYKYERIIELNRSKNFVPQQFSFKIILGVLWDSKDYYKLKDRINHWTYYFYLNFSKKQKKINNPLINSFDILHELLNYLTKIHIKYEIFEMKNEFINMLEKIEEKNQELYRKNVLVIDPSLIKFSCEILNRIHFMLNK